MSIGTRGNPQLRQNFLCSFDLVRFDSYIEPYQLALQGWGSFVFAYILHMESLADQKQLYF